MKSFIFYAAIVASILIADQFVFAMETNITTTETASVSEAVKPNIMAGNFQLGGGASYTNSKYGQSFDFFPNVSFFIADYISVGLNLGYSIDQQVDEASVTRVGLGPSLAYFFKTSGQIAPFASLGFAFNTTTSTGSSDFSSTDVLPALGLQYFFTNELSFGVSFISRIEIANSYGEREPAVNALRGSFGYFF